MNNGSLMITFAMALIMTPMVRIFARRMGIVDRSRGDVLKIHKKPVALGGGLAIVAALVIGLLVEHKPSGAEAHLGLLWIMAGGLLVFLIGLWDDISEVKPAIRLCAHIFAGIAVLAAGMRVEFIPLWWGAIPLTVLYIAGAVNAANLIDGMDGLCAGLSLVSCMGFFFLGLYAGNVLLYTLAAILFMSVLGFLPYNFNPARIFLGDAGSGFLGFMMGLMAVMATTKPFNIANLIAPLLVIGVPLIDMKLTIIRRLVRGKPLFKGDRDHLYDLLLRMGWSQPKVWSVLCVAQALLVVAAVIIYR